MRDIKYINHILRNVIIYVIFICYAITYTGKFPEISNFLLGLIAYVAAYTPVYFLNDYTDFSEDAEHGKANLYNVIQNKKVYWTLASILLVSGSALVWYLSMQAFILLLVLYLLNIAYTFPPFRLRDVPYARELVMLLVYSTKVYLFSHLIFETYFVLPVLVALFVGMTGAIGLSIYKRHYGRMKGPEVIFGALFILLWGVVVWFYPELRLYFLPMIPTVGLIALLYKHKQIPVGILQAFYFLYVLVIFYFFR